jgi:glycerate dehydrogenase
MTASSQHIVILDGFTANIGDLDWAPLARAGRLTVHERTPAGAVMERIGDAGLVLTNKVILTNEMLARLPHLRYIGILATGTNVVDLAETARRGIVVTNIPGYSTPSVAELTTGLMLELARGVGRLSADVRNGGWVRSPDFCYGHRGTRELAGQTLGLIGVGAIGRSVAAIAAAMGMRILGHSRSGRDTPGIVMVDLDTLLSQSDVVSLHCPLTPENATLINASTLSRMKPDAFLINTARGGLVDEAAVVAALTADRLAGYAADVLSCEPPAPDNPLLSAPRCVITPHIAWATRESRRRLIQIAADNVTAFLSGKPINTVGGPKR